MFEDLTVHCPWLPDAPGFPRRHVNSSVTPEEAIEFVNARFPFPGYMDQAGMRYLDLARTVCRYLRPGERILDFGAGPCDKTAVLQTLGFQCSACDDLQDSWHKAPGNRDQILAFAAHMGIDFRMAGHDGVSFQRGCFRMLLLLDVLEHLHNSPRGLLNQLLEYVAPGGYLLASVPNLVNIRKRLYVFVGKSNLPHFDEYYWHPDPWRGHIREYTREDLRRLTRHLGLRIVELRGCHYMLSRLPALLRPLYQVVTALFPAWRDTWLLLAQKPEGWVPRMALPD